MHQPVTEEEAHGWVKKWVWTGSAWLEVSVPPDDYEPNNPYDGTGKSPGSKEIHPSNLIGGK